MPSALFTPQTARDFQARSVIARKANALKTPIAAAQPQPPPQPEPLIADPFKSKALSDVRERLDALSLRMKDAESDREWDNLSRAYDRLFKVWMVLSQTPGPGNLRPTSPKVRQSAGQSWAVQPAPAPQPAPQPGQTPQPVAVDPPTTEPKQGV